MTYEQILTETRGRVGIIRLNRPAKLNAWTAQMGQEIRDQIERWNGDPAIGAILITHAALPRELSGSVTFILARSFAYHLTSIYALKMAGVFLLTASTIVLRTGITARWTAFVGYAAAALIILGSHFMDWTFLIFPIWVLVVSIDILIREYGSQTKAS